MNKYIVKTELEAVLLIDKDAECIQGIADMLPGSPHYFTKEGIVFANDGHDDIEAEKVPYGMYIIKEAHGISAMTQEMFEKISTPIVEEVIHFTKLENNNGVTVAELKKLVKDLPEVDADGDPFEIWLGSDDNRHSNVCKAIWPLNKRDDGQDIILEKQL